MGHRRTKLPALALGLTERISSTTMIVIAVPVKYSVLMLLAQSTTPLSSGGRVSRPSMGVTPLLSSKCQIKS
jgi:hypothetical protein